MKLGGFEHLFRIYEGLMQRESDVTKLDYFWKVIVAFILRIFRHYLLASFAANTGLDQQ